MECGIEQGIYKKSVEDALVLIRNYNVPAETAAQQMGAPLDMVLAELEKSEYPEEGRWKKICFVIALLFSFCKIFAQDSGPVSFYTDDYYLGKYTIESNKIIFTNEDASEGEREKIYPRNSLKLNNNGYY